MIHVNVKAGVAAINLFRARFVASGTSPISASLWWVATWFVDLFYDQDQSISSPKATWVFFSSQFLPFLLGVNESLFFWGQGSEYIMAIMIVVVKMVGNWSGYKLCVLDGYGSVCAKIFRMTIGWHFALGNIPTYEHLTIFGQTNSKPRRVYLERS